MSTSLDDCHQLLSDLRRLWNGWSDLRSGQMLRIVVGDEMVRQPASFDDASAFA